MTRGKTPSPAASLHEQTVRHHCRALKMTTVAGQFETLAQAAIREGHGHVQYLDALLVRRHENGPPSATTPIQLRVVYRWTDAVGAVRRPHGKHMSPEWRGSRPKPRGARGRGASALRHVTQGTTHPGTSPKRLQNASCR